MFANGNTAIELRDTGNNATAASVCPACVVPGESAVARVGARTKIVSRPAPIRMRIATIPSSIPVLRCRPLWP
jgi:hypothetical protein